MAASSGLLTYDALLTYPEDGIRREILEGVLEVSPSPSLRHQSVAFSLAVALELHVRAHGGGTVFIGPVDVRLSEHNVLVPDAIFVADDRAEILEGRFILGAPSLVIEVVSDSRRDRVRKRDIYGRCGVPEYWIADPKTDRIEINRLRGPSYADPEILQPGDTLTTPLLFGLAIDVTTIFRRDRR